MNIEYFLDWYTQEKRSLPWRETHDPYKIWVSEIFLQQTQASRVIGYYNRFLEKFPTVFDVAHASWDEFLPYFQGLGFYSRGRNMLKTAQKIVSEYNGIFPNDAKILQSFPGIGSYTSAAIQSFAYAESIPALDVNLFRVLGRYWDIPDEKIIQTQAKELYAQTIHGSLLNHAFMDLGASYCLAKKTHCDLCPLQPECRFAQRGKTITLDLSPKAPIQKYKEYSVLVLRHAAAIFLENNNKTMSFPCFYNEEKQDHRHFLQKQAMQQWNITISVRPPFFTVIVNGCRYRFSRCQILQGNAPLGIWESPNNTKNYHFPTWYPQTLLEKFWKMKS